MLVLHPVTLLFFPIIFNRFSFEILRNEFILSWSNYDNTFFFVVFSVTNFIWWKFKIIMVVIKLSQLFSGVTLMEYNSFSVCKLILILIIFRGLFSIIGSLSRMNAAAIYQILF